MRFSAIFCAGFRFPIVPYAPAPNPTPGPPPSSPAHHSSKNETLLAKTNIYSSGSIGRQFFQTLKHYLMNTNKSEGEKMRLLTHKSSTLTLGDWFTGLCVTILTNCNPEKSWTFSPFASKSVILLNVKKTLPFIDHHLQQRHSFMFENKLR